jgi:hypothetical protein
VVPKKETSRRFKAQVETRPLTTDVCLMRPLKGLFANVLSTRRTRFPTSAHARTPFSAAVPAFQQNGVFVPDFGAPYPFPDKAGDRADDGWRMFFTRRTYGRMYFTGSVYFSRPERFRGGYERAHDQDTCPLFAAAHFLPRSLPA